MPRTYQPLGDGVLIKPTEHEQRSKSGLVVPDTAKEKPQEGEVVAVGPGRLTDEGKRIPMDVRVGEHVLFAKYAGSEIKELEEDLLLLSEHDILAKVKNDSP